MWVEPAVRGSVVPGSRVRGLALCWAWGPSPWLFGTWAALPTGTCRFRLGIATGAAVASGPRSDCPATRQPQPLHAGASGKGALRGEHAGRGTDADPAATSTWSPDCLSPLPASDTPPARRVCDQAPARALCSPPAPAGSWRCWALTPTLLPRSGALSFFLSVTWKCVVGIPSKRRGPCCRLGRGSAQGPRGMTGAGIEGDRLGRCPAVRSRSREGAAGQLPAARSDCSPSARAV